MTSALRQQVAKGGVLEIESAGEWWEAIVTKVKDEKIKVHYVGGTEDEDEWIVLNSGRARQPQTGAAGGGDDEGAVRAKKRGRLAAYETVEPVAVAENLPFKRSTVKDTSKRRPWKALKKIIEGEAYERLPVDVPTYTGIEAPPSLLPAKKYCDLTGLEAKYTDPKTKLRYFSGHEYLQIRYLSIDNVEEFLKFRNATQKLK